jgi:hypothetical protein
MERSEEDERLYVLTRHIGGSSPRTCRDCFMSLADAVEIANGNARAAIDAINFAGDYEAALHYCGLIKDQLTQAVEITALILDERGAHGPESP